MSCNVCYERDYEVVKCLRKCSFNVCLKCRTKIIECPQCKSHYKYNITPRPRYIKQWSIVFKASRLFNKRICKNSIRFTMIKRLILHISALSYQFFELGLDEGDTDFDPLCSFLKLQLMLKNDKRLFDEYLMKFGELELLKAVNGL